MPFFKSKEYVGIEPAKCVVIDTDKLHSYFRTKQNTLLVFDVDYTAHGFLTKGRYIISTNQVRQLMKQYPHRIKKFPDHEKGKEKERFYVSVDEMHPYEDFFKIIA